MQGASASQVAGVPLAVCEGEGVALPLALLEPLAEDDAELEALIEAKAVAVEVAEGAEAEELPEGAGEDDREDETLLVGEPLLVCEPDAPRDTLREGKAVELLVCRGLTLREPAALEVPELAAVPLSVAAGDSVRLLEREAREDDVPAAVLDPVGVVEMVCVDDLEASGEELAALERERDGSTERLTLADECGEIEGSPEAEGELVREAEASAQLHASLPTACGQQPPLNSGENALKAGAYIVTFTLQKA